MTSALRHPMFIRIASMLLSLTLLLCLSSAVPLNGVGASVFIALSSLIFASLALGVTIGNLEENFARCGLFVYLAGGNEEIVTWRNLEYSVSLCLSTCNFVGMILNWGLALSAQHGTPYGPAAFFSFMLSVMYLAGAIIALNTDEAEEAETVRLSAYENL
uniref:MARVEL domain-containing protein n=1 Tax=Steinernema glaseri TaxID=37863 RepID=A0A1I8ALV5_9BILA